MKHYKKVLFILLALFLTACGPRQPKEIIVYKTIDVYVPVPCDAVVNCSFKGDGFAPTEKLLECVIAQKRALEYCKQLDED